MEAIRVTDFHNCGERGDVLRDAWCVTAWQCFNLHSGLGSTGNLPVPSGDSPDGMRMSLLVGKNDHFADNVAAVPVGESPTGTGGSPVLPHPRSYFCSAATFDAAASFIAWASSPAFQVLPSKCL